MKINKSYKTCINAYVTTDNNKYVCTTYCIEPFNLRCWEFKRTSLNESLIQNKFKHKEYDDVANLSGVYLLANRKNNTLYIGQTNNFKLRMIQHLEDDKKNWFNEIYYLSNNDKNGFSKTYLTKLENMLITFLNESKSSYFKLKNKCLGNETKLSESEEILVEELFKAIRKLLYHLKFVDVSYYDENKKPRKLNKQRFGFKKYYYRRKKKTI